MNYRLLRNIITLQMVGVLIIISQCIQVKDTDPGNVLSFAHVAQGDTLRFDTHELYGGVIILSEYTEPKGCDNGCRVASVRRAIEHEEYMVVIPQEGWYGVEINGKSVYCKLSPQ